MRQPNIDADNLDSIVSSFSRGRTEIHELRDMSAPEETIPEPEGGSDRKPRSKFKLAMTLIGLYLSLFIHSLDQTVIATSIPTITADLDSASGYAWIGSAFLLAAATSAPIWAKLSDIWGRRAILQMATAGFFFSSILCALSQNVNMLIAGRALQGTAGGGLSQIVNITISDLFSLRDRAFYMATLEVVWAIASAVGPVVGGALAQYVSWRWIFWINLPVCSFAFVIISIFLDVHNPRTKLIDGLKAIDWAGSVSIVAMTVMVLLGLDFGGVTFPWSSAKVICLIVIGSSVSILFIVSEKRLAKYPLIPLSLFTNGHNLACFCTYTVMGFVFVSDLFFLPLFFQSALAASQTESGLLVLPCSVGAALVGIAVGYLVHRSGRYREFVWTGLSVLTLGNGLFMLLDKNSSIGLIIGLLLIPGIGAGCLFSPAIIGIQANVAIEHTGTATSTMFFCELISNAIALVVGEVVFQNSMAQRTSMLQKAGLPKPALEALSGGHAAAHVDIIRGLPARQQALVEDAFADSLRNLWILYTSVSGFGLLVSFLLKHRNLSYEHVEVKTGLKKDN